MFSCLFSRLFDVCFLSMYLSGVGCKSAAQPRRTRRTPIFEPFVAPSSPRRSNFLTFSSKSHQVCHHHLYLVFHVSVMVDCRLRISSRCSFCLCFCLVWISCIWPLQNLVLIFSFFNPGATAPEDWRELRNNKSDTHSHELTELHLADWVSNSTSLSYKTGKKRRNLTRQTSLSSSNSWEREENDEEEEEKTWLGGRERETESNKRLPASHARRGSVWMRLTFWQRQKAHARTAKKKERKRFSFCHPFDISA